MPGAEHLRDNPELTEILKKQKEAGRLYAAICASPAVVLAHHHLIDDKMATVYPAFMDKLPNPVSDDSPLVVDGNCVTSRGPGTAILFALKLVELLYDKEKSAQIAQAMLAE